jgi:hypothetical protein
LSKIKFDTNKSLKELRELIRDHIHEYIADIDGLQGIMGIYTSADYSNSYREKPYITVYPTDSEVEDSGQCLVVKRLVVEIAIFVAGPTEDQNTLDMISYVDCLESLLADYPETESLYDISTENAEYFSRGSTIEKMARIMVECNTHPANR